MMYLMFFTGLASIWAAGQIGPDAQAAIGMATQCAMFMMVVMFSISSGATAAITQSIGMGKMTRARLYIAAMVLGSLLLGILMAAPAWLFAEPILQMVEMPAEIRPLGLEIWDIAVIGLPLHYVYQATGVLFRSTRQVLPPLQVSVLVCLANLLCCLGFGLGWFGFPDFGCVGIMWANVISQAAGALANCFLLRKSGWLRFRPFPTFRWLRLALPYLLRVALPAGAAQLVWQSGYLTLFILVASLPKDSVAALAGLTAGLRAEGLLFMPAMAFNMTNAILVGNSLGMGKPGQAKRIGLVLTGIATAGMTLVALALWPFRPEIADFLSSDPATKTQIASYLSYNLVGTPFSIASQVMGGIMVGAGATQFNLIVYGGTFWVARIPLGWFLGHKLWQSASGVFAAMLISQAIQTLIMLFVVVKVNWAAYAMRKNQEKPHASP